MLAKLLFIANSPASPPLCSWRPLLAPLHFRALLGCLFSHFPSSWATCARRCQKQHWMVPPNVFFYVLTPFAKCIHPSPPLCPLPPLPKCFLNWHLQLFPVTADVFLHHLYLYLCICICIRIWFCTFTTACACFCCCFSCCCCHLALFSPLVSVAFTFFSFLLSLPLFNFPLCSLKSHMNFRINFMPP